MTSTSNPTATTRNPAHRLSVRIMGLLAKGREALASGNLGLADDYLSTAEGLAIDLPTYCQELAGPAIDSLADRITAASIAAHNLRKTEGAFSYAG